MAYNPPPFTDIVQSMKHLHIEFSSFGVKNNSPLPAAECFIDCRGVPDPSRVVGFMSGTGDNPTLQEYVEQNMDVGPYLRLLNDHFSRLITRKGAGHEFDKPFRVVTMCAHGIHRSRAMKHILSKHLIARGFEHVEVK